MGKVLSQVEIDALIAKQNTYKYMAAVGSVILGPLKSAPKIEPDVETKDVLLYETGTDSQGQIITKNNIKLTFELEDVDAGVDMLKSFSKGDNVMASSSSKVVTLTPITDSVTAKTFTFLNCYLQPGLSTNLDDGDDPNTVTLVYLCRPSASAGTSGQLFTYSATEAASSSTEAASDSQP